VVGRLDPAGRLTELALEKREALLLRAAERARRGLTAEGRAEFAVSVGDERLAITITDAELESAAEDLLRRLREPVVRSLRDCGMAAGELSEIVMVGGATRMPVVRREITRMFGRFPNSSVHPDHAVALGAAIQAGLLARDAALDEVRITDVCPFTLGIDTAERVRGGGLVHGVFSPIIERNTPVPVSRVQTYETLADNQAKVEMTIYQGESRDVSGNVRLGALSVPVPKQRAGEVTVDVRFTYDSSGLLEVDVHVPASGYADTLVIVDEEDRRDRAWIETRRAALAKLKFHPREAAENVALMARAERLYEAFIGEERGYVGRLITLLTGALATQDPRAIADARAEVVQGLDALEGRPVL